MNVKTRLAHEALVLAVAQFGGLLIGFFTMVMVSRLMGPEARGVYAWLVTLSSLGAQLASLAPYQAVRAVAAHEPPAPMAGTLAGLGFLGTFLTLPFLMYAWVEPTIGVSHHALLMVAWLAVPLGAASTSLSALVHLKHRPVDTLLSQLAPKALILFMVLALWPLGLVTLEAAVWLNTLLMFVYLALNIAQLDIPPRPFLFSLSLARELAQTLGSMWVATLALFALPKLPLLVMGTHAALAETGTYSIAATLMETVMILPVSVGIVLISHVSRVGIPAAETQRKTGLLLVGGMALVCLVGGWVSGWIIPFLFGQAFAPAVGPFRLLLVAVVFSTLYQLLQPLLMARKRPFDVLLPPLLGVGASGGLSLLLIPLWGSTGAALATIGGFSTLALFGVGRVLRGR